MKETFYAEWAFFSNEGEKKEAEQYLLQWKQVQLKKLKILQNIDFIREVWGWQDPYNENLPGKLFLKLFCNSGEDDENKHS